MKTPIAIVFFMALMHTTSVVAQRIQEPVVVSIQKMKGFSKEFNRELVDSINSLLGGSNAIVFTTTDASMEVDFVVDIYSDWEISRQLNYHSERGQLVYSGTTGERVDVNENGWTQSRQYYSPVTYWFPSNEENPAKGRFRMVVRDRKNAYRKLGEFRVDVNGSNFTIDQMAIEAIGSNLVSFFCLK